MYISILHESKRKIFWKYVFALSVNLRWWLSLMTNKNIMMLCRTNLPICNRELINLKRQHSFCQFAIDSLLWRKWLIDNFYPFNVQRFQLFPCSRKNAHKTFYKLSSYIGNIKILYDKNIFACDIDLYIYIVFEMEQNH